MFISSRSNKGTFHKTVFLVRLLKYVSNFNKILYQCVSCSVVTSSFSIHLFTINIHLHIIIYIYLLIKIEIAHQKFYYSSDF